MEHLELTKPYYILSLDGGGSLGVYTLGVLIELERVLPKPLHCTFDLVYGTSTGAIIASMIGLGDAVERTIYDRYIEIAPDVMGKRCSRSRSASLLQHAKTIYGDKTFDDFLIDIGIVCTDLEYRRPRVFKKIQKQAVGRRESFRSGFGCTIAEAVTSSCAARPFFKKNKLDLRDHGIRELIDGGFVANNPTLFALSDALVSLKIPPGRIRVLSIGTGNYPRRHRPLVKALEMFSPTILTLAVASSNTVEIIRKLFFNHIRTLRIAESFTDEQYRTDFLESRPDLLQKIHQLGRESFGEREAEFLEFFSYLDE